MIDITKDEKQLILNLIKELRAPVPKNLCPLFYRTLTYEGDCELKAKADKLAEKLI